MKSDRCEKELGELLESGDPVRPPGAGARSRAVAAMQRAAAQGPADSLLDRIHGEGGRKMRRSAYVVAFLLVMVVAVAGVLSRSQRVDAMALLTSAAEAMEQAPSVRTVGYGCTPDPSSPTGHRMASEPIERISRNRASERRAESCFWSVWHGRGRGQGWARRIDLDKREWWWCSFDTHICYRADISEVMPEAQIQLRYTREWAKKRLPLQPVNDLEFLSDKHESVETEMRDGRKVAVITVTGTFVREPTPHAERHVFEVDMATNHLLTRKRFAKAEGSEEQLLESTSVEYDVPVPGPPKEAKVVTATARVVDLGEYFKLQMIAPDGTEIMHGKHRK
jgi:hypothetical protein